MSIALLIPCYNAASYLPELFEGIRKQSRPFDEVICYDDGSTDDTANVASSLGAKVLRGEQNHGAAYARNRLIEACSCELVHFHDADDLLDPRFVEVMLKVFESGARNSVLCSMRVVDRQSRKELATTRFSALGSSSDQASWLLDNTAYAIIGLYELKALRSIGGFNQELRGNEDPDLHVRLSLAGHRFLVCEDALVTNLVHNMSFSSRNWSRCIQDRLKCLLAYESMIHSKAQSAALGRQAMHTAYNLYCLKLRQEMQTALALARRLGIRDAQCAWLVSRLFARVTPPVAYFALRRSMRRLIE